MGIISRCPAFSRWGQNIGSHKMRIVLASLLLLVVNCLAQDTHFCPDGWDLHHPEGKDECKCFLFANEYTRVNHADATALCNTHDGWLAEIEDGPDDDRFIIKRLIEIWRTKKESAPAKVEGELTGPHYEDQWWIGAKSYTRHNEQNPGEWIWEHLNSTVEWFDWAPGQPDDYHRQQCLTFLRWMHGDDPDYEWNDWDCNATADYVCERACDV